MRRPIGSLIASGWAIVNPSISDVAIMKSKQEIVMPTTRFSTLAVLTVMMRAPRLD
jgi:hypothetical protein